MVDWEKDISISSEEPLVGIFTDEEKRLLFAALAREIRFCEKDPTISDLVPQLKTIERKIEYDRELKRYTRSIADKVGTQERKRGFNEACDKIKMYISSNRYATEDLLNYIQAIKNEPGKETDALETEMEDRTLE